MPAAETLHARKLGAHEVIITRTNGSDPPTASRLRFPRPVRSIVALESGPQDAAYLAAACLRHPPTKGLLPADIVVTALAPDGGLLGVLTIPDQYATDHYRKILITPEGDVLQMQTSESGVRFIRWPMPPTATERGV